jgi:hypothetical protein
VTLVTDEKDVTVYARARTLDMQAKCQKCHQDEATRSLTRRVFLTDDF